jgi:hypothetical protein
VVLRVTTGPSFVPDFHLHEVEEVARLHAIRTGPTVSIEGASRGCFDPDRAVGTLDAATHIGEIDALLRLSLSLLLPRRGSLLLHGAAVPAPEVPDGDHGVPRENGAPNDAYAVLVGASRSGKSTAAAALGPGLSDELVVVAPAETGAEVSGTPWWRGVQARRTAPLIGCLQRGRDVGARSLRGGAALRSLVPHVVRYTIDEVTDRAIFSLLANLVTCVEIRELACPEGPAFLPFLRRALSEARA